MFTTIKGVELDYDKLTPNDWTLYLTGGEFEGDGVSKQVPPAIIRLNKDDYIDNQLDIFNLFYDPYKNKYTLTIQDGEDLPDNYCSSIGYHLGGFLVNDCELRFMYPVSDGIEYIRGFEDESFDQGFIDNSTPIDTTLEPCQPFNFDFSLDFKTSDCLDYEPTDGVGEFAFSAFSSAFANI